MKAAIITINDTILHGLQKNNVSDFLARLLFSKGFELYANVVTSATKDNLLKTLNSISEEVNTVILLGDENSEKNLKIKGLVAECLKDQLVANVFLDEAIKTYYKNNNIPLEHTSLLEANIPRNSKPIENTSYFLQGFVSYESGRHIIFLPNDASCVTHLYHNFLLNYLESKFTKLSLTKTFKTFGLTKVEAEKLLGDLLKNKNQIKVMIYEQDLELIFHVKYSPLSPKEDIINYLKNVLERLKNFIYTYDNKTLYEVAFEIAKRNNLKFAIAESITGGTISSSLIKKNKGISEFLTESVVCYSNEAKMQRLGIPSVVLDKYSAVSAETAYEMAAGLLETSKGVDVVIATTGYAEGAGEENGLVFIAVGSSEGLHIYKNKFSGTREKIIELASQTAVFYFIKKFKQNAINIEQMFDNI